MGPRELLITVARTLNRGSQRYLVTGSMASMMYGEFRSTLDIDIVVDLTYGDAIDLDKAFSEPEYYLDRDAIRDAMRRCAMFNLIHVPTALKVDFIVMDDSAFNHVRMQRARWMEIAPGERVRVSAPEDVILKKLEFYKAGGSDKHLRDIASMIKITGETYDRGYLDLWAARLGVEDEWGVMKVKMGW